MTRKPLKLSIRRLVVLLICDLTGAQENARVFVFPKCCITKIAFHFGAKFFKPLKEELVDMTYLYYLTGWGNRNDTNRMNYTPGFILVPEKFWKSWLYYVKNIIRWCHCDYKFNIFIVGLLRLKGAFNQIHELLICDGVFLLEISGWHRV